MTSLRIEVLFWQKLSGYHHSKQTLTYLISVLSAIQIRIFRSIDLAEKCENICADETMKCIASCPIANVANCMNECLRSGSILIVIFVFVK